MQINYSFFQCTFAEYKISITNNEKLTYCTLLVADILAGIVISTLVSVSALNITLGVTGGAIVTLIAIIGYRTLTAHGAKNHQQPSTETKSHSELKKEKTQTTAPKIQGVEKITIEGVTEDLKTKKGRQDYFNFLQNHPNIKPICKLYGLNAPSGVSTPEIEKYVKNIFVCIHPDKVPPEEREFCTELFQMVKQAKEECINSPVVSGYDPFFFGPNFHPDPKIRLLSCLKDQRLGLAKKCIEKIERNDLLQDRELVFICICVFIQLNNLEAAIEYSLNFSEEMKLILTRCNDRIKNSINPDISLLCESLNEMLSLKTLFCQKVESGLKEHLPDHTVPHSLYVALKQCYLPNDPLMYEKCLREAIRYCPLTFKDEKLSLISELKSWIEKTYPAIKPAHERDQCIGLLGSFLAKLESYLSAGDYKKIYDDVFAFVEKHDIKFLETAIRYAKNIIHKRNYSFSEWLPSLLKPYGDSIGAYPPATIEQLKKLLLPVRGVKHYINGDKRRAAHYFQEAKEYFILGLLLSQLGEYGKAIDSFGKLLRDDSKKPYSDHFLNSQKYLLEQIFIAMNLHDTASPHEENIFQSEQMQLGQIDEVQAKVLKTLLIK